MDGDNPFMSYAKPAGSDQSGEENPFKQYAKPADNPQVDSGFGAFTSGAVRGVGGVPGMLAGAGAGAEIGAGIGAIAGPLGATAGGFVGGLGGGLIGGMASSAATQGLISQLPDSVQHWLGQAPEQQLRDQVNHPYASFSGELAGGMAGMSPFSAGREALTNGTALQRLASNPYVGRAFSSGLIAGMEAGQEKLQGEDLDWTKIGISAAAGAVMPHTNTLGEKFASFGSSKAMALGNAFGFKGFTLPPEVAETAKSDPTLKTDVADIANKLSIGMNRAVLDPEFQGEKAQPSYMSDLRKNAILGEGEAGYFDLSHPTKEQLEERLSAAGAVRARDPLAPAQADIHQIARDLPDYKDAFSAYDSAENKLDILRRFQEDMLGKAQDKVESNIDELENKENRTLEEEIHLNFLKDTAAKLEPGETWVDEAVQKQREIMAEQAPMVKAAYEKAQAQMDQQAGTTDKTPTEKSFNQSQTTTLGLAQGAQYSAQYLPESQKVVDVAKAKWLNAGLPQVVAEDTAHMESAHYSAWANLFGQDPLTFYNEHAPSVVNADLKSIPDADLRAYLQTLKHVSGNLFDKFDLTKSGTGIGGQQYGAGLYFTGSAKITEYLKAKFKERGIKPITYEVEVPNDHHYLLWAKALKEQPENIQKAIEIIAARQNIDLAKLGTGAAFYRTLSKKLAQPGAFNGDQEASMLLKDAGIAGAKYPVQGDNGGHNYVLYDEATPKIISYEQSARAKITFKDDKATIQLFSKADPSSAMHELGHKWLEELMQFAHMDNAPQEIVDMYVTTMKWLKVKDSTKITTRQHEKFAKGFEQYLRLGISPSRELDSAFGRFKQWLTTIYETVKNLGAKISPEMQNVFDRMLTNNPERASIIAPEKVNPPSLADIHKADEIVTPGYKASGVADQIRYEINHTAQFFPEIHNALHEGTTYEAERRAAEAEQLRQASEEAGLSQRPEAGGQRTDEKPAVGDKSAGEGAATPEVDRGEPDLREPASGRSTAGTNGSGQERGSTSGTKFGSNPNAEFVTGKNGKILAGNIRLENLRVPDDIRRWIQDRAAERNDLMDARTNPESYAAALKATLTRELYCDVAATVREAQNRLANPENVRQMIDAAKDYLAATKAFNLVAEELATQTASAGRTLAAFRGMRKFEKFFNQADVEALVASGDKTLYQLQNIAKGGMDMQTPNDLETLLQRSFSSKAIDALLYYRMSSLLSGPVTHTAYIIGTLVSAVAKPVETLAAASASALQRRADNERVYFGEAMAQLNALSSLTNFKSQISQAWRVARSGVPIALPGETGTLNAAGGVETNNMFMKPVENPLHQIGLQKIGIGNANLAALMSVPTHSIQGIHTFNKLMGFNMEVNRLAYRQAMIEGLQGDAFNKRVASIIKDPEIVDGLLEKAAHEGNKLALNDRAKWDSLTSGFARIANSNPVAKFFVPFAQVEMNIVRQGLLERTPVGLVAKDVRGLITGDETQVREDAEKFATTNKLTGPDKDLYLASKLREFHVASDIARGKMMAGTMLGIALAGMLQDNLTGGCPEDQRAQWALEGKQPYSVRIGDTWYPYKKLLGFVAKPIMLMADMAQVYNHYEDFNSAATEVAKSLSEIAINDTWMGSLMDMIEAATSEDPNKGERFLRNTAASMIPMSSFLHQTARFTELDPYMRRVNSLQDAVINKIPGMSQDLMPKRNIFGEPLANRQGVTPSAENTDTVVKELLRLECVPKNLSNKIRGVELTDEQFDQYQTLAGRLAKIKLNAIVNNPSWANRKQFVQKAIIQQVFTESREVARTKVALASRGTANDILAKAKQLKDEERNE